MAFPDLNLSPGLWPPDPLAEPQWYYGVTLRRMFAYGIDLVVLFIIIAAIHLMLGILTVASLGLLFPLHLLVVPLGVALLYHSLQLAGPSAATIGMRLMDLRAHRQEGGAPTLPQTLVHTVIFYGTLGLGAGILLLFALFNPQRRTIHDFLSGILILRVC
ncbi:MAG TPA: RDD family protein [Candidatus Sulfotelmatobacter sp.]|jgi:uncharacterized RDD family membrane protein YckC|nr:RDD family protein [Candidatus Sulfotelmatobacter sp.]